MMYTRWAGFGSSFFVLILLLVGCARSPESRGGLTELRAQAEERMLYEAREVAFQGQHTHAILLFQRFLYTHPFSPNRDEARWWLARSYQKTGKLQLALHHYQILAQPNHSGPYQDEARHRIHELTKELGADYGKRAETVRGVLVLAQELRNPRGLESVLKRSAQENLTTVVVEIPCGKPIAVRNVSKEVRLSSAEWAEKIQTVFQPIITLAQNNGQAVYAAVTLRCLGEFYAERRWGDWSFAPGLGALQPSGFFDLYHPRYQDYLVSLLSDLAKIGVAGFIFRAGTTVGLVDGLSPQATRSFEKAFKVRLTPRQLFKVDSSAQAVRLQKGIFHPETDENLYTPLFWRWAGWKSRERLKIMTTLIERVRHQYPGLIVGLEFRTLSVTDPVRALGVYSEDWLEMSQTPFDFFVTEWPGQERSEHERNDQRPSPSPDKSGNFSLVEQMVDTLGNSQKLWLILPSYRESEHLIPLTVRNGGTSGFHDRIFPKGVGVIVKSLSLP